MFRTAFFSAVVATALASPSISHAKIFLITHGDSISELGPVADPAHLEAMELSADHHVGFKFAYAGLFWLDLWTWDAEFCVFRDRTYYAVTQEQASMLLGHEANKPLWFTFPPGLVLLVLAALGTAIHAFLQRRSAAEAIANIPAT